MQQRPKCLWSAKPPLWTNWPGPSSSLSLKSTTGKSRPTAWPLGSVFGLNRKKATCTSVSKKCTNWLRRSVALRMDLSIFRCLAVSWCLKSSQKNGRSSNTNVRLWVRGGRGTHGAAQSGPLAGNQCGHFVATDARRDERCAFTR